MGCLIGWGAKLLFHFCLSTDQRPKELMAWFPSVRAPVNFFLVYATSPHFYPILLKLAQIVRIIVKVSPIGNEENPSNIMGIGHFKILVIFFSITR